MRPTQPFMTLQTRDTISRDVAVLLPEDTQIEEREHKGISFIVHLHPLAEGDFWVTSERSTGISFTGGHLTLTKDRAIERFVMEVDALDIDRIHDGLMNALLALEDMEIQTVEEFIEEDAQLGYLDLDK